MEVNSYSLEKFPYPKSFRLLLANEKIVRANVLLRLFLNFDLKYI